MLYKIVVPEPEYNNEYTLEWKVSNYDRVLLEQEIATIDYINGATISIPAEIEGRIQILFADGDYNYNDDLIEIGYIDSDAAELNPEVYKILRNVKENRLLEIDLSNNDLIEIPSIIFQLDWLEEIDLSNNNLKSFDYDWNNFNNLKSLKLKGNNFDFPSEVYDYEVDQLTYELFNYEALKRIRKVKNNNKTTLNLSGLGLRKILPEVFQIPELNVINLSNNLIDEIDPAIINLKKLKVLNLDNNELRYFGKEFLLLENLKYLSLEKNKIKSLRLKYYITEYTINNVVDEIYKRSLLKSSDIKYFIDFISGFMHNGWLEKDSFLKDINEKDFQKFSNSELIFDVLLELSSIVSNIQDITSKRYSCKLKEVNIKDNQIENFPFSIFKIPTLEKIELSLNPINNIPETIINQGLDSVLNYIYQIEEDVKKYEYLFESKLVLVGKGKVGKTSISYKLLDPNSELINRPTTNGIDTLTWEVKVAGLNKDFKFDIWDFAGQKKYDATHQLFITDRTFYLLVIEYRDEVEDVVLEKWLHVITSLAPNSPILIVINKIDDRYEDFEIKTYKNRFPSIIDCIYVSCSNGKDELGKNYSETIISLRSKIKNNIYKLPQVKDKLPKSWIRVREELLKFLEKKRKHISLSEYIQICRNFKLDEQQALYLSRYFHDLGLIVHFSEDQKLKDLVIIDYDWCVEGLYCVLDSKHIQKSNGQFNLNTLNMILPIDFYNKKEELLELMLNFELCFKSPNKDKYIVPRLLYKDIPDFQWDFNNNKVFEFRYKFMPKAIIPRFIVRNNEFIDNKYYWRHGLILNYKGNTKAFIQEITSEKKIVIRIRGKHKKDIYSTIRKGLNDIHDDIYAGIKYQEFIQCNCSECVNNSEDPSFYNYKTLMNLLRQKHSQFPCGKSLMGIDIKNLIIDTYEDLGGENIKESYSRNFLESLLKANRLPQYVKIVMDVFREDGNVELIKELIVIQQDVVSVNSEDLMNVITDYDYKLKIDRIKERLLPFLDKIY